MNLLNFAFLLVLATVHASPVPTHRSLSESGSRGGRKGSTEAKDGDSNDAESENIYNFHNSFIIKPDYPLWYQKQTDKPKQKYPKKWALDENDFLLAHTSWSPMFGKKIQSLIDSTSEKPEEKIESKAPVENVDHTTHPDVAAATDEKSSEAPKEIQSKHVSHQPQRNTEQEDLGLGKFDKADLPYSSQNLNVPSHYPIENFKTQKPPTNGEYVYFNPNSQKDVYPVFAIDEESLSEVHFPSYHSNFNGHSQRGQRAKEENQPSEEEREYQVFLTMENIVESFPNYQGAVSYSYNSIAEGQHQSAGQAGGHNFYSAPAFTSGQYSNQGQSSAQQHFQHGYEQIPQIHDYSYQFGVLPIQVSGGDIESYNKGTNRYLPPAKETMVTPPETKIEGSSDTKDAAVNSEVSKEEVPYQIQISHNVPVQVDASTSEHPQNTDVKVDNQEQVTEVVILESVSSENPVDQGTTEVQTEAENVLIIQGNEMPDAVVEMEEESRNSEFANEEQTTTVTSETEVPKNEELQETSTVSADQETTASPTEASLTEKSVKEIHPTDKQVASLEEGLAASNNPRPELEAFAENALNMEDGGSVLSAAYERDYSAPIKYLFRYSVEDKSTGDIKSHEEERNGDLTKGKYSVHDADGLVRTVDYVVDGPSGFQASVMRKAKEMQLLREKRIMKRLLFRN
ncbi:hypothetical protein J437_LFUL016997 [Ladona fulva]|uniref:Uncharacterized protein n=1 Tax=Ladona fulva TaxID=123851 RepID=A0A8K0KLD1_LADFU|nr:hypothetical protein J437_LFUL016997 [Ladona fulva]